MASIEEIGAPDQRVMTEAAKPGRPPVAILGVPFDHVTTAETIALIEEMIASQRPHYLVTANVDFLVQSLHDVELRRLLFDAHLVLCDGTPLLWVSRLLGNRLPERVAGSDLVPLLVRVAAQKGYRLFFLGGAPETTERAIAHLRLQHPRLIVAGHYSPPFAPLLEMDHDRIRQRIREARPDILFVSFGCPKQEKWIGMHYRSLGVPVSAGVGGTIDFLAGRLARAPRWMQRTGTEWIFRLAQEPRRLFGRYAKDIWYFTRSVFVQWWQLQFRLPRRSSSHLSPAPAELEPDWPEVQLPERLDIECVQRHMLFWESRLANHRGCFFDLSRVRWVDSSGIAALIHLQRRARIACRQMAFLAPSEAVRRALSHMQLERFFEFATTRETAQTYFAKEDNHGATQVKRINGSPTLAWQGEITAANAQSIWATTEHYIRCQALWQRKLVIDLAGLRFIDTTGLSLMVRAKKAAARAGAELLFESPQPDVRNVVRLGGLEPYLLESAS